MAKTKKNTSKKNKSISTKKNNKIKLSVKDNKTEGALSNKDTQIKKSSKKVNKQDKKIEAADTRNISADPIDTKNVQATSTPITGHSDINLLKKIVNTSVEEKQNDIPNTVKENTSPVKEKRKRRKKGERTWEEKARNLPNFEISNFPKIPVRTILITQAKPSDIQNPYQLLVDKYKVQITFRPFVKVEGLTAQEFRNQRVDVLEYSGIIFTSRLAIDHFFRIMNEMRITIPDSVKFICMNEQIAYYMQKYMELKKRRILWGPGTLDDLKNVLKKNKDRKFLLPASDTIKEKVIRILDELNLSYSTVDVYKTVPEDISDIKPEKFDMIVFFTPIAAEALKKYFPHFKQNKTRFAAYSILTANKLKELNYRVDIFAPTIEFPSMVNAIAYYLLHVEEK